MYMLVMIFKYQSRSGQPLNKDSSIIYTSPGVTIGFEPGAYSVVENEEEVMVCVELSDGCLDRSVEFNLFTTQGPGEAEGKKLNTWRDLAKIL